MKSKFFKRLLAATSGLVIAFTGVPVSGASAAVIDTEHQNNYDNFAEGLQLALCFYDANKCGNEVADDGYYSWRGNCHVKDAEIPLVHMQSLDNNDKASEDSSKGDGGASAEDGLYVGTNMSDEFIAENIEYLDPDGNGTVDLSGGWHDAGDHVKFGLPFSYSASTIGWGYYEFRDSYIETGLQEHVEDELRWANDYFMKATFLDDDGNVVAYCYQVGEGNNDHNYWCAPELEVDGTYVASSSCAVKRPAYFATTETPASDMCAGAAASLAVNYLNFKDTDPEYAEKCKQYAIALYDFAVKTHSDLGDDSLTVTSLGYDGGFYTSSYDYDELAWAAVWLYYCTENYDYIDDIIHVDESVSGEMGAHPYTGYIKRIIKDTGNCWNNIWVHCWDTVWGGVFAKLAPITNISRDWYIFRWNLEYWSGVSATDAETADFDVTTTSHKNFGMADELWNKTITADEIKDLPEMDGAFIAKSPAGYAVVSAYGSARYNTAAQLCSLVYAKETGDMTFAEWSKNQMEYLLGDNPMGYAYEVGYEYNYASFPHHRAAHCSPTQSMEDPETTQTHTLYGALVGGPDLDDYHHDETKDYIYNEVTDDYNAAFTGALAGLYYYYGADGKELADENAVIEDFNMSENKAGADTGLEEGNPGVYVTAGKAQETDAGLQVKLVIHNRTVDPPRFMSDMKVRYYFNISEQLEKGEDISYITTRIDYDQEKSFTDGENQATISDPIKYDDNGTYYVEISWQNCNFYGSRVYQFGLLNVMNEETYDTVWDSSNDYSYSDLVSFEDDNDAAAMTKKVTAYVDGVLVWGEEPDGTTPDVEATTEKSSSTEASTKSTEDDSDAVYGDVNVDSSVNVSDVVVLNKYLVHSADISDQGKLNAQCFKDDTIDSKDSLAILRYLVLSVEKLPITE